MLCNLPPTPRLVWPLEIRCIWSAITIIRKSDFESHRM